MNTLKKSLSLAVLGLSLGGCYFDDNPETPIISPAEPHIALFGVGGDSFAGEGFLVVGLDTAGGTLRLPVGVTPVDSTFPFIWIANSGEGTISKIDVKTGKELGRYRTGPSNINGNPSRTTVDQDGNVWVGNRDDNTITKVGLNEFGQCVDKNHNGKIDTSTPKAAVGETPYDPDVKA